MEKKRANQYSAEVARKDSQADYLGSKRKKGCLAVRLRRRKKRLNKRKSVYLEPDSSKKNMSCQVGTNILPLG